MSLKILCDFDGTISIADTTDAIFDRFAPSWVEIETLWHEGKIGPAECMRRQVELMDVSLRELDAALDEIEIDPTFPAFTEFCASSGIGLTVVSDGVDYFIRRVLAKAGLGHLPIRANNLIQLGERKFTLGHPYSSGDCESGAGTCKCRRAATEHAGFRTVLIGDGTSDFCVSQKADFVFAKKSLLKYTRSRGIAAFEYRTFADVQAVFERWPLRRAPQTIFEPSLVEAAA
jgi:2-hydroxy-3-keto-5-methylthiopentenyl-1-phosphate phosphatase